MGSLIRASSALTSMLGCASAFVTCLRKRQSVLCESWGYQLV